MKYFSKSLLIATSLAATGCAGGGNVIDQAVPQAAFGDTGPKVSADSGNPASAASSDKAAATALAANAPNRVDDPVAASESDPIFAGTGTATRSDIYPNMNVEPHGATAQMTDEQRDALLVEMQALGKAHSQGKVSTADYRRRLALLRRLAETHSLEIIKKIEE